MCLEDIGECIGCPLIDAFATDFSSYGNCCVDFWGKAQLQIARIGFLWRAI